MTILGIDTATSIASVALVENGKLIAEGLYPPRGGQTSAGPCIAKSNHAEIVLPLVDSVLRRAGTALSEIGGIAVSIGPGSFTGVRIGLSTAKGLAYGAGIAVVGISTLHANAARVNSGFDGWICPCLDARKNEVYAALFQKSGELLKRLTPDSIAATSSLAKSLRSFHQGAPCLFVGDGASAHWDLLEKLPWIDARVIAEAALPSVASAVGRLGEAAFDDAETDYGVARLVPVYLRRPECESYAK